MYNGNENLINDGEYLPYSMLGFWQWAYSNITLNVSRGTFAEYIVKSALDERGYSYNSCMKTGMEPYDLNGPIIPSTGHQSRIEVKSSAYVQFDRIVSHPERASFSITPAKLPDETGDFRPDAPSQRNSDLYVFTLYTAMDHRRNILDLSWWEFYVLPTFVLDTDPILSKQKTISLKRVGQLCQKLSFNGLCDGILDACRQISAFPDNRPTVFTPPEK